MKILKLSSVSASFFAGLLITLLLQPVLLFAQRQATATASIVNGFVVNITVVDGGTGYTRIPKVSIIGGGGAGAGAIAAVSNEVVTSIHVTNAGLGYLSIPQVVIDPPPKITTLQLVMTPRLKVEGEFGQYVEIQWANALGNTNEWHYATNIVLGSNAFYWIDVDCDQANKRFYRALSTMGDMSLISRGNFLMGDALGDGGIDELPVHAVYVNSFYMDKYTITKRFWDDVKTWALASNYDFANSGATKATNHPVYSVNWYDAIKWCNARSEKEGKVPAYYTDAMLKTVYKTGQIVPYVKWDAGYRLPTEAEYEKAARGQFIGKRFPWGDTITHEQANYISDVRFAYDTESYRGLHPSFSVGGYPYTSPVNFFPPNTFGLYDMAGNIFSWCWDYYAASYYSESATSNPHGPATGTQRVVRGGSWYGVAPYCRVSSRGVLDPGSGYIYVGVRCVLPGSD